MAVRPLKITVLADARQARKELSSFGSRVRGMLGGAAALAGGAGIAAGLRKVVTEASSAQQSLGATEAIFGKFADKVVASSEKAADAVGLSANQYRESANLLGSLFKNQGVALGKLSGETDKHLGLAADLSAMYGGPVTDAVDALTAAYKGEFNQLEKYGVTMKASTIATEADAVAKQKYGKALKDLAPKQQDVAKQLAMQAILFKQTGDAQGTFAKEAGTLAGQQQRLKAELDNVSAEIGTALLPVLTDLAQWARDEVVPALEDFARWLKSNQDEITSAGSAIGNTLLPPLKALAGLVIGAAKAFGSLPGPVKELAVQAAIAAYALPKLTAALTLAQAKAATFSTTMKTGATRTAALGSVARTVGGVGGLTLLTNAATDGESSVSSWAKSVGGGALAGAALGSVVPGVGTAIGALGGAAVGAGLELWDMKTASDATKDAAAQAKPKFDEWAATLDQATGAFTRNTRAMILQKLQSEGLITSAGQLGISTRDLIGATLGQEGAIRRVNNAAKGNVDILRGLEHQKLNDFIYENRTALKAQQTQLRQNNQDLTTWKQALRGVPKKVQTRLANLDYKPTMAQVRALKKQYDLTPKQVRTIIKETGVTATRGKVKDLQSVIKGFGDTKPSNKWLQLYAADLTGARQKTSKGTEDINRGLSEGTAKARPNLNPFTQMFTGNLTSLKGTASSGGKGIGTNLGSGINSGIGGWFATIAATAAAAVRNAAAAARAEAKIKSPSRVMRKIGEQMGEGLNVGLRAKRKGAKTEGQKLAQAVRDGVKGGTSGVDKALAAITKAIEKNVTGKGQEKREKALLRRYRDEYAAIRRNAKAQDQLVSGNYLAKLKKSSKLYRDMTRAGVKNLSEARDHLRGLRDERKAYKEQVKQSLQTYASVTNLDSAFNPRAIVASLQARLAKITQFRNVIEQLRASGLNQSTIDQLVQGGVEGGMAYALAISQGGADAVAEINALQSQISGVAGSLGETAAASMYDAGVQAAEGIVRGLEAAAARIDKQAVKLAIALVKAVKKALGIKSPSRVFMRLGDQVTKGLVIGLDETYVKRSAASMAASLEKGFGQPALQAYASQNATGAPQGATYQVTVNVPPVANPAEVGRQVVSAIRAYERAGGRRPA